MAQRVKCQLLKKIVMKLTTFPTNTPHLTRILCVRALCIDLLYSAPRLSSLTSTQFMRLSSLTSTQFMRLSLLTSTQFITVSCKTEEHARVIILVFNDMNFECG